MRPASTGATDVDGANLALINSGGVRHSLPAGQITYSSPLKVGDYAPGDALLRQQGGRGGWPPGCPSLVHRRGKALAGTGWAPRAPAQPKFPRKGPQSERALSPAGPNTCRVNHLFAGWHADHRVERTAAAFSCCDALV